MASLAADKQLTTTLSETRILCARADRSDLTDRLDVLASRIADSRVSIAVMGEFKVGKGSLINALLGADVCPTESGLDAHGAITIRPGREPLASAARADGAGSESVGLDAVRTGAYPVSLRAAGVGRIEVQLPNPLLVEHGLQLVDFPSSGGVTSFKALAQHDLVQAADAVIFMTSSAQPLTQSEMTAIEALLKVCPRVIIVQNWIDFYPAWRDVRAINDSALREHDLPVRIVPFSATLARRSAGDAELAAESNLPVLRTMIVDQLLAQIERERRREIADELCAVVDQLGAPLAEQVQALADPVSIQQRILDLQHELDRIEQQRRSTSAWTVRLNDSIEDLVVETERAVRDEIASMLAEADTAIDIYDPRDTWSDMQSFLSLRSTWIVSRVVEQLRSTVPTIHSSVAAALSAAIDESGASDDDITLTVGINGHIPSATATFDTATEKSPRALALRGAYSGWAMTGLATGLILNPLGAPLAISIALGALGASFSGRSTVKEGKEVALERRRSVARSTVRRFADELNRALLSEVRQTSREWKRLLRDHYSQRADEASRTLVRQLEVAQRAKKAALDEISKNAATAEKELQRLEKLRTIIIEKVAAPPAPAGASR